MNIGESIRVAIEAIIANKMRSLLTMLGIIIGISAVITIVAIGNGSQKLIQKEFESFGVSRAYLSLSWRESPTLKDYITPEDISVLESALSDQIKGVSPHIRYPAKVNKKNEVIDIRLSGVNEQFNSIEAINMQKGRFILKEDIANGRFTVVIDDKLAKKVFSRTNVIGEDLVVNLQEQFLYLTIVGVNETPKPVFAALADADDPSTVYVPISVMNLFEDHQDVYNSLEINLFENADADDVMSKVTSIMERRHNSVGKNMYQTATAESELSAVNQVMDILTIVIGSIAAISLLVGGIGIMNIMLVSVTERTREIGIRKAVGAKYKNIRTQFLIESLIISSIGGIIGIVLGVLFSLVIALAVGFPPAVSLPAIAVATLFSAGVGVFFGYYPARKAAKLDPIQALRYE